MIIEISNENSIVKWKNDDKDEWKVAEISDLIKAYETKIVPVCKVIFDKEQLQEIVDKKIAEMIERPQGEIKKYKPLELDYNVQCAVENLRTTYWSNEPEKVAKDFTEAEDIIISSICHHGYTVCKRPQGDLDALKDILIQRRSELTGVAGDLGGALSGVIKLIDSALPVNSTCQNSRQVEPERPKNEWKSNKYGEHFCPRCGNYALYKEEQDNEYYEVQSNFCPECGFELGGGAE